MFENSPFKCYFEEDGSTQVTAKSPTEDKQIAPIVVIFVLMVVLIILGVFTFVKGRRIRKEQAQL